MLCVSQNATRLWVMFILCTRAHTHANQRGKKHITTALESRARTQKHIAYRIYNRVRACVCVCSVAYSHGARLETEKHSEYIYLAWFDVCPLVVCVSAPCVLCMVCVWVWASENSDDDAHGKTGLPVRRSRRLRWGSGVCVFVWRWKSAVANRQNKHAYTTQRKIIIKKRHTSHTHTRIKLDRAHWAHIYKSPRVHVDGYTQSRACAWIYDIRLYMCIAIRKRWAYKLYAHTNKHARIQSGVWSNGKWAAQMEPIPLGTITRAWDCVGL